MSAESADYCRTQLARMLLAADICASMTLDLRDEMQRVLSDYSATLAGIEKPNFPSNGAARTERQVEESP